MRNSLLVWLCKTFVRGARIFTKRLIGWHRPVPTGKYWESEFSLECECASCFTALRARTALPGSRAWLPLCASLLACPSPSVSLSNLVNPSCLSEWLASIVSQLKEFNKFYPVHFHFPSGYCALCAQLPRTALHSESTHRDVFRVRNGRMTLVTISLRNIEIRMFLQCGKRVRATRDRITSCHRLSWGSTVTDITTARPPVSSNKSIRTFNKLVIFMHQFW